MPFQQKRLSNPTQLTTNGQTIYTVTANRTAIIKQIVLTNTSSSATTFSIYIGLAATPNALFSNTSISANDSVIINLSQVLYSLETLVALASTGNVLNITISGVENDGPIEPVSTYIADNAISTSKIANTAVTSTKIASNIELAGVPIVPTATIGTSTTQIASTAFSTITASRKAVAMAIVFGG